MGIKNSTQTFVMASGESYIPFKILKLVWGIYSNLYVNLVNTCNVWIKFTPYSYATPDSSLVLPTTISSQLHVGFLVHKVPVAGEELMVTGGL